MDRMLLNTILAIALVMATSSTTWAQGRQAGSQGRQKLVAENSATPVTYGGSDYTTSDWPGDRNSELGQPDQQYKAGSPAAIPPKSANGEDRLNDLDKRVAWQEAAFDQTLTRVQYFFAGLVFVCGCCIAYLWVRLAQLAGKCDKLEASAQAPAAAMRHEPETAAAPERSIASTGRSAGLPATRLAGIPRVQFLSGVIDRLIAGISESRRRRGDVETGYALVGKIVGEGSSRVIVVSGLIDEGPNAIRSGGHHKADREHQQRELELLQLVDGDAMHIGDAHLHPGSMDTCSGGDFRTDTGSVRDSRSQEMVFVIATAASAHWGGRSADSICRDGLKLDFYYLGSSSGYEYRHFRPDVVQAQALAVPVRLRRFAAADPVRVKLDFDNLRRLTAYRMKVGELPGDGQRSRPCVEMVHKVRNFKTIIAFSADPQERPEVYVDNGSQVMQFQPAYLNGGWTGLVWFAPIVLDVEREMTGRLGAGSGNDIETPAGGRSAPSEAKTTGPIGDSHGKLPAIEQGSGRGNSSGNVQLPIQR